ncbi:hypothetical protein [Methylomonas sp. AM2-LC]|uniref:TlpA family protein disulfide reductase n=1 Tax=Methylomonas sp. AM2-LC TaxID=3153301 RepID=UPI0032639721
MPIKIFCSVLLFLNFGMALAEVAPVKPFISGSYQEILSANKGKGFMLAIWSLDCSSCIKDMELLNSLHKSRPELKIILISSDEPSSSSEIQTLLNKHQLANVENWVFADDNSQKLRYEIDSSWYSELPRTYFFSANQQRDAVSGALTAEDYKAHLDKMKI